MMNVGLATWTLLLMRSCCYCLIYAVFFSGAHGWRDSHLLSAATKR